MISLLSLFYTNQNALLIFTYVFVCFCTIEVRIPIWYCHLCDLLSFFCVFYFYFDLAKFRAQIYLHAY